MPVSWGNAYVGGRQMLVRGHQGDLGDPSFGASLEFVDLLYIWLRRFPRASW